MRTAIFSPCFRYHYTLYRRWGSGGNVNFVMLNPSTADDTQDDPTVARCIEFGKRWGFGGLIVTNIFAFRATDPKRLYGLANPSGPDNDKHIIESAKESMRVICAWGVHGKLLGRGEKVFDLLDDPWCLDTTKDGYPKHPLYVSGDTMPYPFLEPSCS